jgi:hypothetical protein
VFAHQAKHARDLGVADRARSAGGPVAVQQALAEGLCEQDVRQPRDDRLRPRAAGRKIAQLRAYFDARPFTPPPGKQAGP